MYQGDIASVLVTAEQIRHRIAELAWQVAGDFQAEHGRGDLLLVGV
ncbi:MAG: hypoxanthine phosphoribosyltransferase, partial [Pseudonocardiaceae bacterium]